MKKYLYVLIIAIISASVIYAGGRNFADALQNCSVYTESGTVNADGVDVSTTKQILGWENNKCIYKETVNFSGINSCVICKFSKSQLAELAGVTKAYDVINQYSDNKQDVPSIEDAKNSAVVKAWSKYMQDPKVCSINMIK